MSRQNDKMSRHVTPKTRAITHVTHVTPMRARARAKNNCANTNKTFSRTENMRYIRDMSYIKDLRSDIA